ncbi:hypothetical protein FDP41_005475 [Naegleria fowleri]|uniref:Uncharacterized protein n=1 Tax=Naegleria fowleri TaxID=5763 RepID=A0A6A5BME1_NAEFO|nr:uncharacterized protein FDP41_005475 [Naegleria fowleri]KAF0975481.1 hypothetical protein FDP41_005475 [Naegleria fowleri]CAG4716862.1 unnamed protein product [Naegleria fowleri]
MSEQTYRTGLSFLKYIQLNSYFLRRVIKDPKVRKVEMRKANAFKEAVFERVEGDAETPIEDLPRQIHQLK